MGDGEDGFSALALAGATLATGVLGWRPADFWAATPADLRLALAGRFGGGERPLSAREFERLRKALD